MKKLYFLLVIVLFIAACAKTVESESKAWDANNKRAQELKGLYPGFSSAIDQEISRAKSLWDAASSISKDEDKIAKMAEANAVLGSGWMGELGDVDGKIRKLRSDASGLTSKATDPNDRIAASSTSSQVTMTISRVEMDLRMGGGDVNAATAIVRRATEDLKSAQRMVDDMESAFRSKKSASDKVATDNKAAEKSQEPTTWKCSYCSKTNDVAVHECGGCGAQR